MPPQPAKEAVQGRSAQRGRKKRRRQKQAPSLFLSVFGEGTNPLFLSEWGNQESRWRLTLMSLAFLALQCLVYLMSRGSLSWPLLLALALFAGWGIFNANFSYGSREAISLFLLAKKLPPSQAVLGWWQASLFPLAWFALLTVPFGLVGDSDLSKNLALWGASLGASAAFLMLVSAFRVLGIVLFLRRDWPQSKWAGLDKFGGLPTLWGLVFVWSLMWKMDALGFFSWLLLCFLLILGASLLLQIGVALLLPSRANRSLPVKDVGTAMWGMLLILILAAHHPNEAIPFIAFWMILHALFVPLLAEDGPGPLKQLQKQTFRTAGARLMAFLRWSTPQGSLSWSMLQVGIPALFLWICGFWNPFRFNPPPWGQIWTTWVNIYVSLYLYALAGSLLGVCLYSRTGWGRLRAYLRGLCGFVGFALALFCALLPYLPDFTANPFPWETYRDWFHAAVVGLGFVLVFLMLRLNHTWFNEGWQRFRLETDDS